MCLSTLQQTESDRLFPFTNRQPARNTAEKVTEHKHSFDFINVLQFQLKWTQIKLSTRVAELKAGPPAPAEALWLSMIVDPELVENCSGADWREDGEAKSRPDRVACLASKVTFSRGSVCCRVRRPGGGRRFDQRKIYPRKSQMENVSCRSFHYAESTLEAL